MPAYHPEKGNQNSSLKQSIVDQKPQQKIVGQSINNRGLAAVKAPLEGKNLRNQFTSITPELLINGNPENGTVHLFKQIHTIADHNRDDKICIGTAQEVLLRALLESGLTEIFNEGYIENQSPRRIKNALETKCRLAFPELKIPEILSDEQLLFLAETGAPEVYAVIKGNVTIRAVGEKEEQFSLYQEMEDPDHSLTEREEKRDRTREQDAYKQIFKYLGSESSDKKIGLVFGGDHKFGADLLTEEQLDICPRVLAYKTNIKTRLTAYELSLEVQEAETGDKQVEIIGRATKLREELLYHLKSPEAVKAALPKMEAPFSQCTTKEVTLFSPEIVKRLLEEELEQHITASPDIQTLIDSLYKSKEGPFASVTAALSEDEYSRSHDWIDIANETHPYTQCLMVMNTPEMSPYVFKDLKSKAAQLIALERLDNKELNLDSQGHLHSMLYSAKDDDVRILIKKMIRDWNNRQNPKFRNNHVKQAIIKLQLGLSRKTENFRGRFPKSR